MFLSPPAPVPGPCCCCLLSFCWRPRLSHRAGQKPAATDDELAKMNESIDALTKKVWPSVVQILVTSYGPREERRHGGDASVVVGTPAVGRARASSSTPRATS